MSKPDEAQKRSRILIACSLAGLVLYAAVFVGYGLVIWRGLAQSDDEGVQHAEAGLLGDMFGGFNAFFSGLAFFGVILALTFQRQELRLQREELQLQREELVRNTQELARSADAQQKSESALAKQVHLLALSALVTGSVQTKKTFPTSLRVAQESIDRLEQLVRLTTPEDFRDPPRVEK